MTEVKCSIEKIESLTPFVKRILLKPNQNIEFKAGQYLKVVMGDEDKRPFSIANAPNESGLLELHIGASEHNPWAMQVVERMEQQDEITVDLPHGKAFSIETDAKPRILIAGGTGFSYVWSLLQSFVKQELTEPLYVYWGTKKLEDMYASEELEALSKSHKNLSFVPVLEHPEDGWAGKTGLVHKVVMDDFDSLEPYQIYIAGRFEMAGAARDDFNQKGLQADNLFGDAYEFI